MHQIFESQCNPDLRVEAFRDKEAVNLLISGYGHMTSVKLEKEDAEALARAVLGIPDLPAFEWDAVVADMRAEAAHEELTRARQAKAAACSCGQGDHPAHALLPTHASVA